jgi:ABC-type antimicrobial peptide transport system permease subunit
VVANTLYEGPREGVRRQVFIPQSGNSGAAIYVRAGLGSSSAYGAVRRAVKELDAGMPLFDLKTLGRQLDETLLTERLTALLSAGFGLLATLLAAIGLYGVMAFVVARRTKEMGLRMALGARSLSVIWLVMKEVLLLLGIGLLIGVPSALALGRFVAAQLYGIKGGDPGIASASILLLAAVAVMAGLVPAHRASRIDPILALRYE